MAVGDFPGFAGGACVAFVRTVAVGLRFAATVAVAPARPAAAPSCSRTTTGGAATSTSWVGVGSMVAVIVGVAEAGAVTVGLGVEVGVDVAVGEGGTSVAVNVAVTTIVSAYAIGACRSLGAAIRLTSPSMYRHQTPMQDTITSSRTVSGSALKRR